MARSRRLSAGTPGVSENSSSTCSGFSRLIRTWIPPTALPLLMSKRLTASGAVVRSRTLTPVEFRPLMIARLRTRHPWWVSRLVVT
jgi:hypothetical protein